MDVSDSAHMADLPSMLVGTERQITGYHRTPGLERHAEAVLQNINPAGGVDCLALVPAYAVLHLSAAGW